MFYTLYSLYCEYLQYQILLPLGALRGSSPVIGALAYCQTGTVRLLFKLLRNKLLVVGAQLVGSLSLAKASNSIVDVSML